MPNFRRDDFFAAIEVVRRNAERRDRERIAEILRENLRPAPQPIQHAEDQNVYDVMELADYFFPKKIEPDGDFKGGKYEVSYQQGSEENLSQKDINNMYKIGDAIKYSDNNGTYVGIVLNIEDDNLFILREDRNKKNILVKHNINAIKTREVSTDIKNSVLNRFSLTIMDHTESGELFGLKKAKSRINGNTFKSGSWELGYSTKNDVRIDTVKVTTEDRILKFLLSDCKINIPNYKGFNVRKDRNLKIKSKVKVIDNTRNITLNPEEIYEVIHIERNKKSSRRLGNSGGIFTHDIVVMNNQEGLVLKTFAKNLKVIENE